MKMFVKMLFVLPVLAFVIGCGSSQKDLTKPSEGDVPAWFLNQPADPNFIFGVGTATSQDLQLCVDKAATTARAKVAQTFGTKVQGLQKRFQEEIGGPAETSKLLDQFTSAVKVVTDQTINGAVEKEKKVFREGNVWRAYVLIQLPVGAAAEQLMNQISKSNELYTRFRSTQAFEELEKEIQNAKK